MTVYLSTGVQFSSVQLLSHVWLLVTPWTAARQTSLSITHSWSLLKLMSIESVMPSNRLILCRPLLLPPWTFPRFRVFFSESVLHIRRPKYWSFSFSISPSNEQAQGLANFHSWAKSNFLPFKIYCIIGKNLRNSTSWHMEIIWHSNCSVSKVLGGYSHHHCLCFVCICFCTAVMEVNSCNRHMACRA